MKRLNSDVIWNVVGALAAIALLLYLLDSFFGLRSNLVIPVSGGEDQAGLILPTVMLVTPHPTSTVAPADPTDPPSSPLPPSASPTQIPTATDVQTADPFPAVVHGYGPDAVFTLHRLAEGESYTYLAELYDTTVEVLESLNYQKEGKRLWVGQYIVVISGLAEPRLDLPQFVVLQIEQAVDLADIALEYGLVIEQLRRYNSLSPQVTNISMRLLLVPILGEQ